MTSDHDCANYEQVPGARRIDCTTESGNPAMWCRQCLLAAYDAVRAERDQLRRINSQMADDIADYQLKVQRLTQACDIAGRRMVDDLSPDGMRAYADFLDAALLSKQPAPEVKQAAKPEGGDDAS